MNFKNFSLIFLLLSVLQIFTANFEFTLLTWNVLGLRAMDWSDFYDPEQNAQRPKRVLDFLSNRSEDIVCLQEVSPNDSVSGGAFSLTDQRDDYTRAAFVSKGRNGGCVVFFKNNKFKCLWHHGIEMMSAAKGNNLGGGTAACALLEVNGTQKQFLVCSVHLSRGNSRRGRAHGIFQMNSLVEQLTHLLQEQGYDFARLPLILAGDFNTFYEEVLQSYCPEYGLNMLPHKLFTVSKQDPDGSRLFASIDHILYRPAGFLNIADSLEYIPRELKNYSNDQIPTLLDFYENKRLRLISSELPSDHAPLFAIFSFGNDRQPQPAPVYPKAKIVPVQPKNANTNTSSASIPLTRVSPLIGNFLRLLDFAEFDAFINDGIASNHEVEHILANIMNVYYTKDLEMQEAVSNNLDLVLDHMRHRINDQKGQTNAPVIVPKAKGPSVLGNVKNLTEALARAVKITRVLHASI